MADAEPRTAIPDLHEAPPVSEDAASDAHGEHEASDVVDQDPIAQVTPENIQDNTEAEPASDEIINDEQGNVQEATQSPEPHNALSKPEPASDAEVTKKDHALLKGTSLTVKDKSAKPAPGKATPSTPTAKKASHTSGTGGTKLAPASKATATSASSTLSKSSASPSTVKRISTSSTANPPAKTTTMASSRGPTSGTAPPSRRSSMLPPRAPSATGAPPAPKSRTSTLLASLASSTSKSPPADANPRPSVVSPVGSVASLKSNALGSPPAIAPIPTSTAAPPSRPRAVISEAVKRTPSSSRQSLPPAAAPPPQPRAMRPMGSISSIREVRDDSKALDDLQGKLKEANENFAAKLDEVAALEAKISQLEASLSDALADVKTKAASLQQLQTSKQSSDAEILEIQATLRQVQFEHSRDLTSLNSIKEEVEIANKSVSSQNALIETLRNQIQTLTVDLAAAQDNFESLRSSSDQSSAEAAAAAQMEREAFLRAKAEVETITAEVNSLRAARNSAVRDAATRLSESQQSAAEVTSLVAQINELKVEREESAAKISELEIEILELRESQEHADDDHKKTLSHLQKVEAELAEAVATTQRITGEATIQEKENAQKVADAALLHANEVQIVKDDLAKALSEVETLKSALAAAHAAHEEISATAEAAAEAHEQEMEETEQSYLSKHIELSEEIKRLVAELEDQESKYGVKVAAVKSEHDLLLRDAFERAKSEAAEAHSQDLQALRVASQATIEQLRAAHQSTVNDLQAEHRAALESLVGELEKKLNGQSLELRATQDDLTKAKAALDASRAEGENLKVQLEEARASFISASANSDLAAEIERLTKELSNLRDENVMLSDVLSVTKESLSQMSTTHVTELEEAARARVEEVVKLRSVHEGEISTLAAQKSELALSLSDLEGELAMLKAQLAAVEPVVSPRSNGVVHASTMTVTREELQKIHEAHNLKMHDLQAEHERVARALRGEVEALQARLDEVQQDVARKSMEIQYLEQEQEENQDSITRLKADLEALKAQ